MKLKRKDTSDEDLVPVSNGTLEVLAESDATPTSAAPSVEPAQSETTERFMPKVVPPAGHVPDGSAQPPVGGAGQQLGDVLVLRGLVTHAQVQEALEKQQESGGRLGELLAGSAR